MPTGFPRMSPEISTPDADADISTASLERVLRPVLNNLEEIEKEIGEGKKDVIDWLIKKEEYDARKAAFDATGAFTEAQFHKRLAERLSHRGYELDELGLLKAKPDDKNTYWVGATLPDLPLVNLKGAHRAGDITLGTMTLALENGLTKNGGWENTDGVFHMRGGDFIAHTISTSGIKHIYDGIQEVPLPTIYGTNEIPRIAVADVNLEEAIKIFNEAQTIRGINNPNTLIIEPQDVQKEVSGIIIRLLDYKKEYAKVVYLGDKMIRGISKGTTSDEELETYYNTFVKKYFEGNIFAHYDAFKDIVKTDINGAISLVKERAERIAAITITSGTIEDSLTEQALDDVMAEMFPKFAFDTLPGGLRDSEMSLAPSSERKELLHQRLQESIAAVGGLPKVKARHLGNESTTNDPKTYHRQFADKLHALVDGAREELENYQGGYEELAMTRALIESSNLDQDVTILGKKVNLEEEIGALIDKGSTLTERERITLLKFIDLAKWRLQTYEGRHDRLTGLGNKFEFYKASNAWIEEALTKGKEDVGVFFIDLGYINYFNQFGNRRVGNNAIITAVSQLETELKKEFGAQWELTAKMFRYGGDEISILHKGGAEVNQKIKDILNRLNAGGKKIEAVGITNPRYREESIKYNYGHCNMAEGKDALSAQLNTGKIFEETDTDSLRNSLQTLDRDNVLEHGPDTTLLAENLSKAMTKMSDHFVSYHKVIERFKLLMDRYTAIKRSGATPDWDHFRVMLSFSGKSLSGVAMSDFDYIYNEVLNQEAATGFKPNALEIFKDRMKGRELDLDAMQDIVGALIITTQQEVEYMRDLKSRKSR